MATTIERQEGEATERRPRGGWATVGIATVALVAMAISVVLVLAQGLTEKGIGRPADDPIPSAAAAVPPTTFRALWCEDELEVIRAAEAGILPRTVLDDEPYRTKRLIAQGLIPRQAAEPCE
jgi:hypothetical protein